MRNALTRQLGSLMPRNVRDGAAIVVDNASGDVLAYVGSAGPYSTAPAVDGRARRTSGRLDLKRFCTSWHLNDGMSPRLRCSMTRR